MCPIDIIICLLSIFLSTFFSGNVQIFYIDATLLFKIIYLGDRVGSSSTLVTPRDDRDSKSYSSSK